MKIPPLRNLLTMELLEAFSQHLLSGRTPASKLTVKNYLADLRRFLRWYETAYHVSFDPAAVTVAVLERYRKELETAGRYIDEQGFMRTDPKVSRPSLRSVERYFSTLRKFFSFLAESGTISSNPFDLLAQPRTNVLQPDPWHLRSFKDYLHQAKVSDLTVKNYLLDLEQFFAWFTTVAGENEHYEVKERDLLKHLDRFLLEEYKRRLIQDAQASPNTVNRKLSSLRRYVIWAEGEGYIRKFPSDSLPTNIENRSEKPTPIIPIEVAPEPQIPNLEDLLPLAGLPEGLSEEPVVSEDRSSAERKKGYSAFPPLRLVQRLGRAGMFCLDMAVLLPLARTVEGISYVTWRAQGSPIFRKSKKTGGSSRIIRVIKHLGLNEKVPVKKAAVISNLPKSFYAPLSLSVRHAPLHRKVWHHARYTRPAWYRRYHSYKFVHYVHAAILVLCMSATGFGIVQAMSGATAKPVAFASLPDGPPRILAFSGKLTRRDTSPITAKTILRFGIYNDPIASGSSQLWEEAQSVTPTADGSFSTLLGQHHPIPQRLFKDNARLYIGMTIGTERELTPRKEIPTEALAATSETVQGLRPITDPQAGEKNTILALNSSGDLVIGGKASPAFIATGGSFTLSGQTVMLTTETGSNTDIVLEPDGSGKIDLRKPIQNTSNHNTVPDISGAVEIADSLLITAEQSSQSALFINQNTSGPLISASVAGIAKFTLANSGAATFGDSVTIEGGSLVTSQTSFNLLTTGPINLAVGTSATSLSLGASGGTTTINNAQTVIAGNLSVNGASGATFGNSAAGISFSGNGNHLISATAGSLELGAVRLTGNTTLSPNTSITPAGAEGVNDLGSATTPFDTLYVTNIVSPGLASSTLWQNRAGLLSSASGDTDLAVGGTASGSAVWQVFATGANAGTASSSGGLTFRGAQTAITQLNGGSLTFRTSPGGEAELKNRLTILGNGNIGIGTSTPNSRLDLADGTGEALSWVSTSSRRFKHDITAIADPLDKIGRLQGVYYTWDEQHGGSRALGFIAEDVGKVVPEVVEWDEDGVNAKGISYGNLTALAIEGIKSQQEQIALLTGEIDQLRLTRDRNYHILTADGSQFRVVTDSNEPVETSVGFAKAVVATLETGLHLAETIRTHTLQAGSGLITDLTASHLTTDYIETKDIHITGSVTADKAAILSLRTDAIRGTGADSDLSLSLGASSISVVTNTNGLNTSVATIDNSGNATFTGTLTADSGRFSTMLRTQSLSAEEEVTTKKLIAQELDLSDAGMAQLLTRLKGMGTVQTLPGQLSSAPLSIPTPTPATASGSAVASSSASQAILPGGIEPQIVSEYSDLASSSGELAMTPTTTAYPAQTGTSQPPAVPAGSGMVLADLSVADTVTVNGNFILSEASLNVVGADLQIQPLRSGGVSFLSGLVAIDTSGNLNVAGSANFARDVTVRGKLAASVLSPVDAKDLVVSLDNANKQSLVVSDASGEAGLRIKASGDVQSLGGGSFARLLSKSLSIVRGTQADASPILTVASSSAGTATILPGQTQRTIITPFVTEGSLVYITPVSDTQGVVPYVSRQTAADTRAGTEGSFTIQVSQKVSKTIKVNWWIVN